MQSSPSSRVTAVTMLALAVLIAVQLPTAAEPLTGIKLVSAEAPGGGVQNPANVLDGDPKTEFSFAWGNGGATLVLDLGGPRVLERIRVTNGHSVPLIWLTECSVGPDATHFRPLLGKEHRRGPADAGRPASDECHFIS